MFGGRVPGRWPRSILPLLLLGDALLIAADVLHRQGVLSDARLLVTRDAGLPEFFQYFKAALGAGMVAFIAVHRRSALLGSFALFLLVILADDALMVHEIAGELLASIVALPEIGSARRGQVAEMLCLGGVGVTFLALFALCWRSAQATERRIALVFGGWLLALGFFAGPIDLLGSITRTESFAPAMALLEDGGEMVMLSLLLAAVWREAVRMVPMPLVSVPAEPIHR